MNTQIEARRTGGIVAAIRRVVRAALWVGIGSVVLASQAQATVGRISLITQPPAVDVYISVMTPDVANAGLSPSHTPAAAEERTSPWDEPCTGVRCAPRAQPLRVAPCPGGCHATPGARASAPELPSAAGGTLQSAKQRLPAPFLVAPRCVCKRAA